MIKPLKHYSIPAKCQNDPQCPFESIFESDLYMPKSWETRYDALELNESNRLRADKTGSYTPQGGCTDGTYIYRALVTKDESPTWLQKMDLAGNIIAENEHRFTTESYGHANDMTYCSKDGYLYIAHSSSTNIVYKVDRNTLQPVETITVPAAIWGIAYNSTDDLFVVGTVGSAYLSVYTYDWQFMYRIKPQNAYTGTVRQGIECDDNYIYVNVDNAYGAVIENDKGSRIMVYTWNGMFIKSYYLNIAEIEFMAKVENKFYIGTYNGRDAEDMKSGDLHAVEFDLYPEQTELTGRPTEVSGGLNNLQRLPEGTPVRLWVGSVKSGSIKLQTPTRLVVDEDGPFRYLRFRFKGANQQVFDWYPLDNGVVALRETDITDAVEDTTIRIREARLTFDKATQTFIIEKNFTEQIKQDFSENTISITKDNTEALAPAIEITQIWGVV